MPLLGFPRTFSRDSSILTEMKQASELHSVYRASKPKCSLLNQSRSPSSICLPPRKCGYTNEKKDLTWRAGAMDSVLGIVWVGWVDKIACNSTLRGWPRSAELFFSFLEAWQFIKCWFLDWIYIQIHKQWRFKSQDILFTSTFQPAFNNMIRHRKPASCLHRMIKW